MKKQHELTSGQTDEPDSLPRKSQYELAVLDLACEFRQLCTLCGNCCSNLKIPLYPTERSIIARQLRREEVSKYIWKNPYPFNIQSEFYFVVDGTCPFLEEDLCRIYPMRPLVCRLFPVQVKAFLDGLNRYHREPLCDIPKGEPHYSCMQDNIMFRERVRLLAGEFGSAGLKLIDYLLATVLDDATFAFLYGQEPQTGLDRFVHVGALQISQKHEDYAHAFFESLVAKYQNPTLWNVEVWDRLEPLNEGLVQQICDPKNLVAARQLASRYKKRIQKYNPSLAAWRAYIRKRSFE